jgi:hypothetical protein
MTTTKSMRQKFPAASVLARLLTFGIVLYGCGSSAGRPAANGGQGGDTGGSGGDTGGTGGTVGSGGTGASGSGGSSAGGQSGSGGTGGSGGSAGSGGTGGDTGGAGGTGGSTDDASTTGGAGGGSDDAGSAGAGGMSMEDASSTMKGDSGGGGKPTTACTGTLTPENFCDYYEKYCMYNADPKAPSPTGKGLPPAGQEPWYYQSREDCITRYTAASMAAKTCRSNALCQHMAGGCTHSTGHFMTECVK